MFIQDIKKQNKALEDIYEGLEFIQDACRDQGVTEGMKKRVPVEQHFGLAQSLANVEEKCQKQADIITQKKQVHDGTDWKRALFGSCDDLTLLSKGDQWK